MSSVDSVCTPSLQRVDDLIYDGFGRKSVTVAHEATATINQGTLHDGLRRAHAAPLPDLGSAPPDPRLGNSRQRRSRR